MIYVMAGTPDWSSGGEANWQYNPALDAFTGVTTHDMLLPTAFRLEQNYPNPFNPKTVVSVQWPVTSVVRLVVYDVLGKEVAVLADGRFAAGTYSFVFDGSRLASGVYFCRMTAGAFAQTIGMVLTK